MIRKLSFVGVMIVVLVAGNLTEGGVSLVKNGSFEADGTISNISTDEPRYWCDVNVPTSQFGGYVNTAWSSHDSNSLAFYSKSNGTYNSGDEVTVSQQVYLADVNQVIFDVELTSEFPGIIDWDPNKFSAFVMIDGNSVWDSNSLSISGNDEYHVEVNDIDISDINLHTLSIGMKANATISTPYYISYIARFDFVKFDTHCGGLGYLAEDFNRDCYVNFVDYATLANYWLEEVAGPNDIYDLTEDDGVVDMDDIGIFTAGWLDNSDWRNWGESNCYQAEMLEADLNGDGTVNFKDYGVIAGEWLNTGDCIEADIDCSGTVGWEDVSRMAGEWLMRDWRYGL